MSAFVLSIDNSFSLRAVLYLINSGCRFVSASGQCKGGEFETQVGKSGAGAVHREPHVCVKCVSVNIPQVKEEVSHLTAAAPAARYSCFFKTMKAASFAYGTFYCVDGNYTVKVKRYLPSQMFCTMMIGLSCVLTADNVYIFALKLVFLGLC